MSRCATFFCSLMKIGALPAAIALAAIPAAPALASASDPFRLLYLFPGVRDDGSAINTGVATSIHCFSFSGTAETLQFIVRDFTGALRANLSVAIVSGGTRTASTHGTVLYSEDLFLNSGQIQQGSVGVTATSANMVCTAHVLDASAAVPNGIDLHPIRFNPFPETDE